jgi:hypothetical protein
MQITDILGSSGGLQNMARELGVSESEAQNGAQALLPAILGGFKRQAQSQPGGVDDLEGLIGGMGGPSLLEDVLSPQPTDIGRGNNVLGQIFGSKDVSRSVAETAAARSGVQPSVLKKMLPMIAMAAAGYMARQRGGMDAGMLGGAMPRGRGGLASMIDLDGDGNPLDDIMRIVGRR